MGKYGRERGWRKFETTRIKRLDRFAWHGRCYLTIGAFSGKVYCGIHGLDAGWPCSHPEGHRKSELSMFPGVKASHIVEIMRTRKFTPIAVRMELGRCPEQHTWSRPTHEWIM